MRLTPEAVEVIRRSFEIGGMDPSTVGVRLRRAGGVVRPRFAEQPEPDDVVVDIEGVRVFVDPTVAGEYPDVEIAVSDEHDELVVRPGMEA